MISALRVKKSLFLGKDFMEAIARFLNKPLPF